MDRRELIRTLALTPLARIPILGALCPDSGFHTSEIPVEIYALPGPLAEFFWKRSNDEIPFGFLFSSSSLRSGFPLFAWGVISGDQRATEFLWAGPDQVVRLAISRQLWDRSEFAARMRFLDRFNAVLDPEVTP